MAITIYNSYSSLIKDTRRRKGLETFTFGKDITKNKIGVFENNDNLPEIYFIIYQKSGSTVSKYLDYITLYTENDINITIDAYYETNKCYKFSDNRTHLFNFELRDFENYYLQYQIYSKSQKTISYVFKNKNNEKIDNGTIPFINKYSNNFLEKNQTFYVNSSDDNNYEICFDFLDSQVVNITRESTEYSRIIISPGDFYFFTGTENIQVGKKGHLLLTFNYIHYDVNITCKLSDKKKPKISDFSFIDSSKSDCEYFKDSYAYENYHIHYNKTDINKATLLIKVTINYNSTFNKQIFSIYKSYPEYEINANNGDYERNISLFRNPYFFKMKIDDYKKDTKVMLLTNDDITMNVILGNFTKDNYKKYSNKINHIHILDINELKNKEIKEVNIMLHTAIPHQKCYFLHKIYDNHTHFIINNENTNNEKSYKIEINDCINDQFYYIGLYNYENEERIGFIDYIYGIGESYYLNYVNNTSLENQFKILKNNFNSLLNNISLLAGNFEIVNVNCTSPILAYLNIYPSIEQNIEGEYEIKEGEKFSFFLKKFSEYKIILNDDLSKKDKVYYEILLLSKEEQTVFVNISDKIFNITENEIIRDSFEPKINQEIKFISYKSKALVQLKIGICEDNKDYYIGNLSDTEIKTEKKNLILNLTKEDIFKELQIHFQNSNSNQRICSYFGYAKFPFIFYPKNNCFNNTNSISISYPFEKIINNNDQKSYYENDSYLLIFSFENTINKIQLIKKDIKNQIKIDQQPYFFYYNENKTNYFKLQSNKNYTIKTGMVIYISYFNSENEKISDIEKKREGIIDYSLSYGNSIIKKEKLISNGTGRIIYNFKDNFLDFDLEINSKCSYNLVLKKYILNE